MSTRYLVRVSWVILGGLGAILTALLWRDKCQDRDEVEFWRINGPC